MSSWFLGNWQLNWMLLARSGSAVHPDGRRRSCEHRRDQLRAAQPRRRSEAWTNPTVDRFFNAAAFAIPVNSFGDAERNILRGPGYWNVDLGLQRNIRFAENMDLQVRVEAFNVFNHINWAIANPFAAIDNPATVGRINSMTGRPRQLQFGARLLF